MHCARRRAELAGGGDRHPAFGDVRERKKGVFGNPQIPDLAAVFLEAALG